MKNSKKTPNYNPIIAIVSPKPFDQLIIKVSGSEVNLLEIDRNQRVYHFRLRQQWIVNNHKIIENHKANPTEKSAKIIQDLIKSNSKSLAEIDNIRYASQFLKELPLLDIPEYQEINIVPVEDKLEISDDKLIEMFSSFIKKQKTDYAISVLKPMLADHLYSTRKMALKD